MVSMKLVLACGVALGGAALICPICTDQVEARQAAIAVAQQSDTATARLHISGMTCGTCPATARVALKKLPGVFSATVTYEDSLAVVRYDPRRVTPAQLAMHLTRLTGYRTKVLADSATPPRTS
ncbi:MAG: heavy metal-associated domain-containing protein [Gemmatimonadaceae bacterium]